MPSLQEFVYGITRAYLDAELERIKKIILLSQKGMELRQLLTDANVPEKQELLRDLDRYLMPYRQISHITKNDPEQYLASIGILRPEKSEKLLILAGKMIDYVNTESFFRIFDLCRQAGARCGEFDALLKKINNVLDKSVGQKLDIQRLRPEHFDFLMRAVPYYSNFSETGKALSQQLKESTSEEGLQEQERKLLNTLAETLLTLGTQLSDCLSSLLGIKEDVVQQQNTILAQLLLEKNKAGQDLAELNKKIVAKSAVIEGQMQPSSKDLEELQSLMSSATEKEAVFTALIKQVQAVSRRLTEDFANSRTALTETSRKIQELSKEIHQYTHTVPISSSPPSVNKEDEKEVDDEIPDAGKVKEIAKKFEALLRMQKPSGITRSEQSTSPAAAEAARVVATVTSPRATPPKLIRSRSNTAGAEGATEVAVIPSSPKSPPAKLSIFPGRKSTGGAEVTTAAAAVVDELRRTLGSPRANSNKKS